MKKIISRIALIILLLAFVGIIAWVIASSIQRKNEAVNREYDEAEVLSAAAELIEKSLPLNTVFWGEGIPYVEDANYAQGNYYPADSLYLEKLGISTVEELKNLTRGVYSDDLCEWIFNSVLSSVTVDGGTPMLARYVQKWGGDNLEEPEYILVYKDADYWLVDKIEYSTSMEVIGSEGERVKVRTLVTVTNSEGKIMNINKEIALVEEADGWRLDTPTYARYYEQLD